jgi:hypothetical protein
MKPRLTITLALLALFLVPALAVAQVNFTKHSYYVGMGDSVAAGEGAMPVTNGYVYRLYDESVFDKKKEMDFTNMGTRGTRRWDLRHDPDVVSSAQRVAQAVDLLLNNDGVLGPNLGAISVLDPVTKQKCRALQNVTILVSNYYIIPHPVPEVFQLLNAAVQGFNQALSFLVLQQVVVPTGSRIAVVDLYTPSLGRQGLVTIQRRLGYTGPFDFDIHPTNLGHAFIAGEFKKAWNSLP